MRTLRHSTVGLALVLAVVAGCAKCGGAPKTVTPVDRFVAPNAAAVLTVPTLSTLAQQSADLLATAATFPGGKDLLDARAVIGNRLTFDPFDATSISGTGLDPARGLALSAVVGPRGEQAPDVVLSLPVADTAKFDAAVTKIAKERIELTERTVEAGSPEVIAWRPAAGGPIVLAYAVVEQTALLSAGPAPVEAIRAAAAIPATATIATNPAYQKSMAALGDGLAFRLYVPPASPALKELPQLKDGLAAGLRGGRDRLGIAVAVPVGAREAGLKAAIAKGESKALLAKLDAGAAWVVRGDNDASLGDLQAVTDAMEKQGLPPPVVEMIKDFVSAIGSGSAMGIGLPPPADGAKAKLAEAPLAAIRAEILLTLKDPEKMTATIQRAIDMATEQAAPPPPAGRKGKAAKKGAPAKPDFGKNPWRVPLPGGEIAAAVADGKFALVAGPAGALEALLARSGTTFKGPTPAADKALAAGAGGMYIDVPRLAAAAKAYPESAFGDGGEGAMIKSMVDQWSAAAARVLAVSVSSDLADGVARGELLVEVTPTAPAATPAAAPAPK
jgi:hypothetical protein